MTSKGIRSIQEEQHKYLAIDRKFGSGHPQEINEALDDLESFFPLMQHSDLINSLVLRLIELLLSSKP